MATKSIQVPNEMVTKEWWDSREDNYPILDKRWFPWENGGHRYFVFEYPKIIEAEKDPRHTNLDPWLRPVRLWKYYTDDYPLFWQSREQEHPSRNSMFFPKCPVTATHYAYTSIDNMWFNLYLVSNPV